MDGGGEYPSTAFSSYLAENGIKCEFTIECIHVGFARERKAYLLYSREHQKLFELRDVEFEEVESREQVTVDSDSEVDEGDVPPCTRNGDPEGEQVKTEDIDNGNAIDTPSLPSKKVDHQEAQRPISDDPAQLNDTFPPCCSAHSDKG